VGHFLPPVYSAGPHVDPGCASEAERLKVSENGRFFSLALPTAPGCRHV